jgi:hypothetical protein
MVIHYQTVGYERKQSWLKVKKYVAATHAWRDSGKYENLQSA